MLPLLSSNDINATSLTVFVDVYLTHLLLISKRSYTICFLLFSKGFLIHLLHFSPKDIYVTHLPLFPKACSYFFLKDIYVTFMLLFSPASPLALATYLLLLSHSPKFYFCDAFAAFPQ